MKREYRHRCAYEGTELFHLSPRERSSRAARRERVRVPTTVAGGRTLSPNPSPGGRGEYFRLAYRRAFSAHAVPRLFYTPSDARFPA